MREAIDLPGFSAEVIYPASIFSLERHESLSYDRFAYNIFRESITELGGQGFPPRLVVKFCPSSQEVPAWLINASVRRIEGTNGYEIRIPELLPPLMFLLVASLSQYLVSHDGKDVGEVIQAYVDNASAMVRDYREYGLASAIRNAFTSGSITLERLNEIADDYDWLSYFVANHEIAHIYLGQLEAVPDDEDRPAYEYLADLVSVEWQFRRFVHDTPHADSYFEMKGVSGRSEAMFDNCKRTINSHFYLLILMGISGAQQSEGRFHLEAGRFHPGSFSRFYIQTIWLMEAIEAQVADELGPELNGQVKGYYESMLLSFGRAGIINEDSVQQLYSEDSCRNLIRAAEIAEEGNIKELMVGIDLLRSMSSPA